MVLPRILVVEDETALADALARGLSADGFAVEVTADGISGLMRARGGQFDVIVLDLLLPGMSGYQVCRRLRETSERVPILVLTAKRGEWDETEALDTGADDFMTKPFSYPVLLARIRALLRRTAPSRSPIGVGGLRIDGDQRRCWRNGTEVELTAREFSLLEYLARNAGRTVTKAELLDEVWDCAMDDDSNIVEVYVGYLRRKLDLPCGSVTIRTLRGAGYRMDDDGGRPPREAHGH